MFQNKRFNYSSYLNKQLGKILTDAYRNVRWAPVNTKFYFNLKLSFEKSDERKLLANRYGRTDCPSFLCFEPLEGGLLIGEEYYLTKHKPVMFKSEVHNEPLSIENAIKAIRSCHSEGLKFVFYRWMKGIQNEDILRKLSVVDGVVFLVVMGENQFTDMNLDLFDSKRNIVPIVRFNSQFEANTLKLNERNIFFGTIILPCFIEGSNIFTAVEEAVESGSKAIFVNAGISENERDSCHKIFFELLEKYKDVLFVFLPSIK